VLGGKACSYCAYSGGMYGPTPNIPACIDCVALRGPAYRGACNACAQAGAGAARCMQCLGSFPLAFCPEGAAGGGAGAAGGGACWSTTDRTPCDVCGAAAKSPAAYEACIACYRSSAAARGECQACTWLDK
jgi:hypothetical protein